MTMRKGLLGLLLLALAAVPSPGVAQPKDAHTQAVDALLTPKTADTPGIAVSIYHAGHVIYTQGYGLADLEQGTPVTPKTRFHVASVTKEFTALAAALLAEDGKLDLAADARRYLPWLPDFGATITVSDLIHHTAGLKDSNILFWMAQREAGDHLGQTQLVAMVKRQHNLIFPPGTQFSYSNMNYAMLAEVIQTASGQGLRQFSDERIFKPLGMTDSLIHDDIKEIIPRKAASYEPTKNGWRISPYNSDYLGAAGLFTTAEDMGKWLGFFDHPTIGGPGLLKRITTPGQLRDGTPLNYAFGLYRARVANRDAITHSGSTAGHRALVTWLPEERFGVVLMANGSQDLGVPTDKIIEEYLGPRPASADPAKDVPPPIEASAEAMAAMQGHYLGPKIWSADLVLDKGKLYWQSTTLSKAELTLRANDSFSRGIGDGARYFRFERDGKGAIIGFRPIVQIGATKAGEMFRRSPPVNPSTAELAPLVGDYYVPELDITYHIALVGSRLVATSLWSNRPADLTPVARDRFDTNSIPLGSMEVRRNKSGKPIGFEIVGGGLVGTQLERRDAAK